METLQQQENSELGHETGREVVPEHRERQTRLGERVPEFLDEVLNFRGTQSAEERHHGQLGDPHDHDAGLHVQNLGVACGESENNVGKVIINTLILNMCNIYKPWYTSLHDISI